MASFSVSTDAESDDSWQQFPAAMFDSAEKAETYALAVARSAIDLKFTE
jgi:hypothetical protein